MKVVIQRVSKTSVTINNTVHSEIGNGLLVLLGISTSDVEESIKYLAAKIADLRIFSDDEGKMNLSVKNIEGEIMLISQFTLCADNGKSGNRPSFMNAMRPEKAEPIYEKFIQELKNNYKEDRIKTGIFGADMKVELLNDGPVTIILEN